MSLELFVSLLSIPVSDVAFQAYYSVTNKKVDNASKKLAVRIALAVGTVASWKIFRIIPFAKIKW